MWKPANTMQNIHSFLSWTTLAALTESVVKGSWSTIPAIPKRPVGWNVCPSTYTSSVAAVYRMWPTILVSSCWLSLRKKKNSRKNTYMTCGNRSLTLVFGTIIQIRVFPNEFCYTRIQSRLVRVSFASKGHCTVFRALRFPLSIIPTVNTLKFG